MTNKKYEFNLIQDKGDIKQMIDIMSDCTWCKWNWKNHEDFYKKREDKNEV